MSKLRVVCGAQYGSESKGRTAGFLLQPNVSPNPQLTIRVGGPQAGHIVVGVDPDEHTYGYHWKLRSVPVGAVCRRDALLGIASGSEIDYQRLDGEVEALNRAGYDVSDRIIIDPAATILTPDHKAREDNSDIKARIGSTSTGVGAARTDRIMRVAATAEDRIGSADPYAYASIGRVADVHLRAAHNGDVLVEAAQGCHLDLYRGEYPFTTSGRTTAIDALAAAEIAPWAYDDVELQVWLAVRVNPIRVGGNSGPLKNETSWDQIGVEPERTTVTNRVRRVAEWDPALVRQSVTWCGSAPTVRLSLSHFDYLFPEAADLTDVADFTPEMNDWLKRAEDDCAAPIALVGVGPDRTLVRREDLI